MNIDVYTSTGTKKGTLTLPKELFESPINEGLMHQALVRQQSNRRAPVAHTKNRGEIQGSTRKLFAQKGTGRARRGSVRSPLLRGGNKAFGPLNNANFIKNMPRAMRRRALFSCLSMQAKSGKIIGLESYPDTIKTKDLMKLLEKLPTNIGRHILLVTDKKHEGLALSARNITRVKTVQVAYLNPEDVLKSFHIVFLVDAIKKAEEVFGTKEAKEKKETSTSAKATVDKKEEKEVKEEKEKKETKKPAKVSAKKATVNKSTSKPQPKP
ncbi:MAG: 50S ribosomal protein L4 [Kiritimatiellales bacterium]|nr:50S ribosomal protein L4 [Kiritimatiellales bacterium]